MQSAACSTADGLGPFVGSRLAACASLLPGLTKLSASLGSLQVPAGSPRAFTSGSFWEVGNLGQARHELLMQLHAVRSMMPDRNFNLSPHFTPHGVQLMPHGSDLQEAAAVDPLSDDGTAAAAAAGGSEMVGVLADSVKRKRKLKMKKHKYKKRMKKLRHQLG